MIVCVCHRVSDRDIAHAVGSGCATLDELQDELRVATACGACVDCARQTLEAHRNHATRATRDCRTAAGPAHVVMAARV